MKTVLYSLSAVALLGASAVIAGASQKTPQGVKHNAEGGGVKTASFSSYKTSQQPKHVVELFTSQGCSSCPSANKFVADLAEANSDALILSYGVTYWDYLGWKDTFGDPAFTQRQRNYGKSLGAPNIYTPQIVINGSDHNPRYTKKEVSRKTLLEARPSAALSLSDNGYLQIKGDVPLGHSVSIVRFTPGPQNVAVKRGENSGRTLRIENVVADVDMHNWNGRELRVKSELVTGQSYAALFHTPASMEIVTAAVLRP